MEKVTLPHEAFERSRGLRRGFHSSDCCNRDKNCAVQPISSFPLLFSSLLRAIRPDDMLRENTLEFLIVNLDSGTDNFKHDSFPALFFFFSFQRLNMNIHFYTSCKKRDISGIHKIE